MNRRGWSIWLGLWLTMAVAGWPAMVSGQTTASGAFKLAPTGREVAIIRPHPWSGWYWPWARVPMAKVLAKYDTFVARRTGRNPGAAAWERKHHRGGEEWSGHCNGWAAAAALEPEPRAPRTVDGMTFTVGEQKGLLSELYMDCYHQFYGTRCYSSKSDPDILPHHFHRLLLEYMKERQVPIVIDADAGSPVWNYPAYAFETTWTTDARRGKAEVTTKLYLADDNVHADFLGTKGLIKTYRYTLDLNAAGEVIGGAWARGTGKNHPDFVWVPTANSPPAGWQNPAVEETMVRAIVGNPAPAPPAPPSPPSPPSSPSSPPPPPAAPPASSPAGVASLSRMVMASEPAGMAAGAVEAYDAVLQEAGLDPAALFATEP